MIYYGFDFLRISLVNPSYFCKSYFDSEFTKYSSSSSVDLEIRFVDKVWPPLSDNFIWLDNKSICASNNFIFSNKSSFFIDDSFLIQKYDSRYVVSIRNSFLSSRLLLLRVIYPILRYILFKKDFLLLKGSSVLVEKNVDLYCGWSGSGKTEFVLNSLKNGAFYISDTLTLINASGFVCPVNNALHVFWRNFMSTISLRCSLKNYWRTVFFMIIKKIFSLMLFGRYQLSTLLNLKESKIFNDNPTPVRFIYIDGVVLSNSNDIYTKLLSINRSETLFFDRIIHASNYASNDFFVDYWPMFEDLLQKFLKTNKV
jgi:hypothetical protein